MSLKHIWIYSSIFLISFHTNEGRIMVLSLLLSGSVRFFLPLPCTISRDQAQQTRSSTSMPHFRTTSTNFMPSTEGTYSLTSPQQLSSCSQQAFLPNTVAGKSIKCPHTPRDLPNHGAGPQSLRAVHPLLPTCHHVFYQDRDFSTVGNAVLTQPQQSLFELIYCCSSK